MSALIGTAQASPRLPYPLERWRIFGHANHSIISSALAPPREVGFTGTMKDAWVAAQDSQMGLKRGDSARCPSHLR